MSDIVNKRWGFCHQMRHDGIDYGDYIEQLTYLMFLEISDEHGIELDKISWVNEKNEKITTDCSWAALLGSFGTAVLHYFSDHRAGYAARPARQDGFQDLRPGLRHRRLSGLPLRMAFRKDQWCLDRTDSKRINKPNYYGQDLAARPRRLALMNLYLLER